MIRTRIKWAIFGLFVGLFLAAAAFYAWWHFGAREASTRQILSPPVVVREIQRLSELVSVKYTVQKVVAVEEKKVPFGSEKLLLFVQAEVLGGMELSGLAPGDVALLPGGKVAIALPPPKIMHIVIDDQQTKVWDRRITWWTPWVPYNPDLERRARLEARKAIEQAALDMGILGQAQRNAESAIRNLLEVLGVKSVTFASRS